MVVAASFASAAAPPRYAYAATCLDTLGGRLATGGGRIRSLEETIAEAPPEETAAAPSGSAAAAADGECGDSAGGSAGGGAGATAVVAAEGAASSNGLIVCTTALNVCRFTGRYLLIMQAIPSIALDGSRGLRSLVELYMHLVFAVFHSGVRHVACCADAV